MATQHRATERTDSFAAADFLRAQACWLRDGLQRAEDPVSVRMVLRAHDAAHPAWCVLIGHVRSSDPGLAAKLDGLYAYHGRVAGALDRGRDPLLADATVRAVRALLADRLEAMTESVCTALLLTEP